MVDAFLFDENIPHGRVFLSSFLSSPDFDNESRKRICKKLRLSTSGSSQVIVDKIVNKYDIQGENQELANVIIQQLVSRRNKGWVSFKIRKSAELQQALNISELIDNIGQEKWYGPVIDDIEDDVHWYVHPVLIEHWQKK